MIWKWIYLGWSASNAIFNYEHIHSLTQYAAQLFVDVVLKKKNYYLQTVNKVYNLYSIFKLYFRLEFFSLVKLPFFVSPNTDQDFLFAR